MVIKDLLQEKFKIYKDKLPLVGLCVLLFVVGFGTGRADKNLAPAQRLPNNYNANAAQKPAPKSPALDAAVPDGKCLIKGNLSTGGKKIYHVPGGRYYKTVKPEQCFVTEAAARAAGFKKSRQ